MKAILQTRYGSPDDLVCREIEDPVAQDDEVVVRVRAAGVHPDVWHVVTGRPYVLRVMGGGLRRPRCPVPGIDMAGVVEAKGRNVTQLGIGDEVFGDLAGGFQWQNGGGYAERVAVRATALERKPPPTSASRRQGPSRRPASSLSSRSGAAGGSRPARTC